MQAYENSFIKIKKQLNETELKNKEITNQLSAKNKILEEKSDTILKMDNKIQSFRHELK